MTMDDVALFLQLHEACQDLIGDGSPDGDGRSSELGDKMVSFADFIGSLG